MKFWVRDKVAVYMGIDRFVGHVVRVQERILHVQPVDRPHEVQVAPQQCRRLVKKKRREIWVNLELMEFSIVQTKGWIRFREVKE